MKWIRIYLCVIATLWGLSACDDNDTFTVSPGNLLTFSTDTVKMDTVFSTIPTPAKSFWVYNKSGDGIRCTNIRLEKGNQTGFRVNVDGAYLGQTSGFQVNDIEVRNKDSIRVFVELTSPLNYADVPQKLSDNLVFMLESGVEQKVNLNAYSWDAEIKNRLLVTEDQTIEGEKPILINGGIVVEEGATLTIAAGTTLYFHADAGIEVKGRLVCEGTSEKNVVLRGDRIDHMFDYLPYDRVSGQWQGIRFREPSYGNRLSYTDIHSTFDGVVCDSSDVDKEKLTIESSTIHNCQGYGLQAVHSNVRISNTQVTNTLRDCVAVDGGKMDINQCTLAQFYPYDANRGAALYFSSARFPVQLQCRNSLITGYADDVLSGEKGTEENVFDYAFSHCIIRTPEINDEKEKANFEEVQFEDVKDTLKFGRKHFLKIDIDNLAYDFRLAAGSPAIGMADPLSSLPMDRNGVMRDDQPDAGAYEYEHEE